MLRSLSQCSMLRVPCFRYISATTYKIDHKPNPILTVEIGRDNTSLGSLQFMLFENVVPHTSQNFRRLLLGQGIFGNRKLSLLGTSLGRVHPRAYVEFGTDMQGGPHSIYGRHFHDESYELRHDRPGLLTSISEDNTNDSRFAITLAPCPFLDLKQVVFGEVSQQSLSVLRRIERLGLEASTFKILKVAERREEPKHSHQHH